MFRLRQQDLQEWWQRPERKPLILRGARQVGKSTLVRQFCQAQQLHLHEINFETERLQSLTSLEGLDIDLVLAEIEAKTKKKINPARSLIFFDEIQASPVALQALRYFLERRPDLAVVAAGSLLEFLLDDHAFSIPVGRVEFLHVGPMSFFEFLRALGDDTLVDQLATLDRRYWSMHHAALQAKLRLFFFVGGMPEAVATYVKSKSVTDVSRVHAALLQTYKADFARYKTRIGFDALSRIFDKLPAILGKKVKYASLMPDEKSKTLAKVISLFVKARLLYRCEHTQASGLPLSAQADESVYKLYFLDIGLLHHAMQLGADVVLSGQSLLTQGLSAEQFVAQHLAYAGAPYEDERLFYWLKDKDPKKAEIDFLLTFWGRIVPVEVKSGKTGTLKSLHYFMQSQGSALAGPLGDEPLAVRIDNAERGEFEEHAPYRLLHLPLFMVEQIRAVVAGC